MGVVNPTPNPQPGGPGYPFLSGSSPLTYLAWEALPVAYATASIALRIMWPHKPPPLRQSRDTFGGFAVYYDHYFLVCAHPICCFARCCQFMDCYFFFSHARHDHSKFEEGWALSVVLIHQLTYCHGPPVSKPLFS